VPIFDPFTDSAAVQGSAMLTMGDGAISVPGGGVVYTLYDTFSSDFAAGSVNGTKADTGQVRTVTDGNSKLSISGGAASVATGGVGGGNPGLWYPQMTRRNGLMIFGVFATTGNGLDIGWDGAASGTIDFSVRPLVGNVLTVRDSGSAVTVGAAPVSGTAYTACVILRSGGGCWYLIKGGIYTNWTLIWISATNTANMFPGFTNSSNTDAYTIDNVRVPQDLFVPNPLAYDTFTRANGALGSTETTGPDSQAISALAWAFTTGIWTISTNAAIATPTVGADVIVNGAFAADTDWTKGSGWSIAAGVAAAVTASSDLSQTVAPLTVGRWYQVQYTVSGFGAGTVQAVVGGVTTLPTHNANATYTETCKAGTTAFLMRGAGFTGSLDNISAKLLTTAELLSSVQVSKADVVAEVAVTMAGSNGGGVQAGLVLNLDSTSNPQNFILVYLNGNGSLVTEECVAGVYTTKATTSITYAAGAALRAIRDGTSLRLFYNNGTAGGVLTMTANVNTLVGLFSTSASNSLDNFLVWPRGSSNEHGQLDLY
jgi:hypothetical protein